VKRVVRGNLVLTDTDGFAIDIDLSQFLDIGPINLSYFLRLDAINLLNSLIFFIFQSRIELLFRMIIILIYNYNKLRY